MKTLLVTVLLAVLLMTGSALKCNHCISGGAGSRCISTTETCGFNQDACVTAILKTYPFSYFKRCIKLSDCLLLQGSGLYNAVCCQTDRCN